MAPGLLELAAKRLLPDMDFTAGHVGACDELLSSTIRSALAAATRPYGHYPLSNRSDTVSYQYKSSSAAVSPNLQVRLARTLGHQGTPSRNATPHQDRLPHTTPHSFALYPTRTHSFAQWIAPDWRTPTKEDTQPFDATATQPSPRPA